MINHRCDVSGAFPNPNSRMRRCIRAGCARMIGQDNNKARIRKRRSDPTELAGIAPCPVRYQNHWELSLAMWCVPSRRCAVKHTIAANSCRPPTCLGRIPDVEIYRYIADRRKRFAFVNSYTPFIGRRSCVFHTPNCQCGSAGVCCKLGYFLDCGHLVLPISQMGVML
jgi:hypothetical protein